MRPTLSMLVPFLPVKKVTCSLRVVLHEANAGFFFLLCYQDL